MSYLEAYCYIYVQEPTPFVTAGVCYAQELSHTTRLSLTQAATCSETIAQWWRQLRGAQSKCLGGIMKTKNFHCGNAFKMIANVLKLCKFNFSEGKPP